MITDAKFCPTCGAPVPTVPSAPMKDPRLAVIERALGNKYRILTKAGSGGFSDVYLGEHIQLGRKVAVKILLHSMGSDPEMVERFRRESKAAAKLSHPNIIDIYDVGESEGVYYFVMKYIEGETLGKKMQRERRIEAGEAIDIIRQVSSALGYAHENNVVHRDIKPGNVMMDLFGKPVLMDFGIARMQVGENLTRTGTLMGTPHYLPPEQPLGKPVDGRSDIYSLGIMFYEMLAGKVPFHDEAPIALIYRHINEPPPPLHEQVPDLDPLLCDIVHRMIEKLPEKRFQTAHEVSEALEPLAALYPGRPTPGRKSAPGAQSTEKLRLLAIDHIRDGHLSKAIDIFKMILQRDPQDSEAKKKIEELVGQQLNLVQKDISERNIEAAKTRLTQLQSLLPNDGRLTQLRSEVDRVEQKSILDTQFNTHYTAARKALEHQNASAAMDHLTKALTVDPENQEAQSLLRTARAAYEKNRIKAEFTSVFTEAEVHFNNGHLDLALTAIQKALEIDRNQQAVDLAAKIEAGLKNRAAAMQVDQQLKKADVFLRMGQVENAREECRKVLAQNPEHAGALAKMREIENLIAQQKATQEAQQQAVQQAQQQAAQLAQQQQSMKQAADPPQTMQLNQAQRPSTQKTEPQVSPSGIRPAAPLIPAPPSPEPPRPAGTRYVPAPAAPGAPASKSSLTGWIIGGVAILVIGVAAIFLWPASKDSTQTDHQTDDIPAKQHDSPPPPTATTAERIVVSIDTQPWTNFEVSGPTLRSSISEATPAVLELPAGQYTVVFSNPQAGGKSITQTIDVNKFNTKFSYPFPDLMNPEKLADSIVK